MNIIDKNRCYKENLTILSDNFNVKPYFSNVSRDFNYGITLYDGDGQPMQGGYHTFCRGKADISDYVRPYFTYVRTNHLEGARFKFTDHLSPRSSEASVTFENLLDGLGNGKILFFI